MEPTNLAFGRARWICALLAPLVAGCVTGPEADGDLIVGLVTKTEDNPFFVTMREAAIERAGKLGVELRTFAGRFDGDTGAQVRAIESLVAADATGILITPSDPVALLDAVGRARRSGVLVIALDTPFDPADAVDGTFATDNFRAGELIGMWARASMGASAAGARIATLDGAGTQVTVEVLRNQGFLEGFGIDIKDPGRMYDEDDPRIAGHAATMGAEEGGRAAMERLMRDDPGINVVYAINEPAAAGAYEALRGLGVEDDVLIVTIDGGCEGVRSVAAGEIGATAMQYPVRMASLGIEAVVEFSTTGATPENTPGLDFHDTGVTLVTEKPVPGIPSMGADAGLSECWG
ncbi:MAG: substrate-binding domain-containing protein [Acidobacteriota bacterium]|nr:substrate-binding domain-containing protein [Acidobacteriota bacterium]